MHWQLALLLFLASDPPRPRLAELARFPPLETCQEAVAFNSAFRNHLSKHKGFSTRHDAWLKDAEEDAWWLWWLWDSLKVAQDPSQAEEVRLHWLLEVRNMLPGDWWMSGRMPPPVPLGRFTSLD